MDMVSIAKEYLNLQKRSANNIFDAVTLYQDFVDIRSQYWTDQINFNGKMRAAVDEWRVFFKKGREDSIKMVNDGFKYMETVLDDLNPPEKKAEPKNIDE
jgi:hypothetical protein